jgi:hypothetical protein
MLKIYLRVVPIGKVNVDGATLRMIGVQTCVLSSEAALMSSFLISTCRRIYRILDFLGDARVASQ